MTKPRFYLQRPHIQGLAVIDRQGGLVISSFGDTDERAEYALGTVVDALNAAIDPQRQAIDTDAFKEVYQSLRWRVIEYLSILYVQSQTEVQRLKGENEQCRSEMT